jgi:hypothetical protein
LFRPTAVEADLSKSADVGALVKQAEQTKSLRRIEPVTNATLQDPQVPMGRTVEYDARQLHRLRELEHHRYRMAAIFAGIGVEPLGPGRPTGRRRFRIACGGDATP